MLTPSSLINLLGKVTAILHTQYFMFFFFWRGQCVSGLGGGLLRPSQTSGQALMRSRSREVGVGPALGKGHMGLTIKDECKPIPVEKTPKKTSPCTC